MANFRFYLLNDNGSLKKGAAIIATTDDAAIAYAIEAANGAAAELWSDRTLVWSQPNTSGPEA